MVAVRQDLGLILVDTPRHVTQMVNAYLQRDLPLSFDIETTGLDPRKGKLISLQFYQQGHPVSVIDARRLSPVALWELWPLFDGKLLVLGHNLKFDFLWLMEKLGIYPTRCFDTMLAEQVITGLGRSEATATNYGLNLKALAHRYLGRPMSKEERSWFIDLDQRVEERPCPGGSRVLESYSPWDEPLPDAQLAYAAEDVRLLPDLYEKQLDLLRERNLTKVARLEMDALPAIASIEQSGVHVDVAGWRAFIAEKQQEAERLESQAIEVFGAAILSHRAAEFDAKLAEYQRWEAGRDYFQNALHFWWESGSSDVYPVLEGESWGKYKTRVMGAWRERNPNPGKPKMDTTPPNIGSPAQLIQALLSMGIPAVSTRSEVLAELEDDHPEVRLLLGYRRANKFVTSFGEALLQYVHEGRIHPEYVQIGASTGRMSCTRPNWQQVPSKGDGKKLRELVIAEPGNKLLTADFSNIELRILADLSGDETMLRLFEQGADLHTATARMMFNLPDVVDVKHVTLPGSDQTYRAVAKVINFGLVYGMSPNKLARTIHVSLPDAKDLFAAYFHLYPGVSAWLQRQRQQGKDRLYSTTLAGRKRYYSLPPVSDPDFGRIRSRVERQSMNSPIQGTSADITKQALVNLYQSGILQNQFGLARIVAVVHDEIVLEAAEDDADTVTHTLAIAMGDAASAYLKHVSLPPVEVVIADHWSKE